MLLVAGRRLVVYQTVDDATLEQVFLDDLRHIRLGHAAVERALGIDDHDRTERAQAETAGLHDLDLVGEAVRLQLLLQMCADGGAARRGASRTAADQYM